MNIVMSELPVPENHGHSDEERRSTNGFEAALAAAFRQAANSITVTDLSGNFLEANQAFSSLTGYPREELLKMNIRDLLHSDDQHLHQVHVDTTTPEHCNFELIERLLHKDGRLIWVKNCATRISDRDRGTVVVSMVQDISEEKKIREQARRMQFLVKTARIIFRSLTRRGRSCI